MLWIVMTSPSFFDGEVREIKRLFDAGVDIVHLRKPQSDIDDCRRLLNAIPSECLKNIVTHDHFSLCGEYSLKGVHLNSRNPYCPAGHRGSVSRSCHSFEEVSLYTPSCDYLFLSPIFDSISKAGYVAAFSKTDLKYAYSKGFISDKVMALGGINSYSIPIVRKFGFGGAVFHGDIWNRLHSATYSKYLSEIETAVHHN